MKIIIDECLPKRLTRFFQNDEVWTVPQNQQEFHDRCFGTIIIRSVSNRFSDLIHFEKELQNTVKNAKAGIVLHVPA